MGSTLGPIRFDLEAPGTYVFTGPQSTRGYRLNRFALSLKQPDSRAAFLADEAAYLARYGLAEEEAALVRARDWTGLLRAGGHLQAVLKLAATTGQGLWHIGAHNAGVDVDTLQAACPRRVAHAPTSGPPAGEALADEPAAHGAPADAPPARGPEGT